MNANQTLTVMVRQRSGREFIIPAIQVEFVPNTLDEPGLHIMQPASKVHLPFSTDPDGDRVDRDVFVMNAAGQTVARYSL